MGYCQNCNYRFKCYGHTLFNVETGSKPLAFAAQLHKLRFYASRHLNAYQRIAISKKYKTAASCYRPSAQEKFV
jgi:hypothetical protein